MSGGCADLMGDLLAGGVGNFYTDLLFYNKFKKILENYKIHQKTSIPAPQVFIFVSFSLLPSGWQTSDGTDTHSSLTEIIQDINSRNADLYKVK